jgi:hypothetical protein
MKLSEILNELLDRGFNPRFSSTGILCEINLDNCNFGLTIAHPKPFLPDVMSIIDTTFPESDFVRCVAWESYSGDCYFDRLFRTLDEAIFAGQMAAILDDARLTEAIVHLGN